MTTILPPIPRFVFTIFEPLSLIAGALGPILAPVYFVQSQLPHLAAHPLFPSEHVLAIQLGNLYLLLGLLGIGVLNTTSEPSVVHAYVWALWVGDIGHVAATVYSLGVDRSMDVGSWNGMAWGNIGVTCMLFLVRSAYMAGLLGQDRGKVKGKAKKV
ncbi:MAG: hypothetical protein M1828_000847 [Chrysothrix sp. TS-e1954]|nr:MAG: hypothetical protein M1828_000847 [Chrysothrix sp. TS-e1954]